jgi:hypothetical protein
MTVHIKKNIRRIYMTVKEVRISAKRVFYGKYKNIALNCAVFFMIILLKKTAELTALYFLIAGNFISMNELFISEYVPWNIFRYSLEIISFIFLIPVTLNTFRILSGKPQRLCDALFNIKFAFLWICIKIINLISFLPSAVCIYLSFRFLSTAYEKNNGEGYVSVSFMCLMLAVIFLWLYAYVIFGTVLIPFIYIKNPDRNIFAVIADSFINMNGNRSKLVKLIICFIPWSVLSIFIASVPFISAKFLTWYSIYAENILENERNCYYKKCRT